MIRSSYKTLLKRDQHICSTQRNGDIRDLEQHCYSIIKRE